MKNIVLFLAAYLLLPALIVAQSARPVAPAPASSGSAQASEIIGIGVELKIDSTKGYKSTLINGLIANGAAQGAGLQKGDIIMNVDNKSTINVPLKNVVDMIKGEEGTSVKLVVERSGSIFTYNIVRKKYTYAANNAASTTTSATPAKSIYELEFEEFLNDDKTAAPAEEKKAVTDVSDLDFSGFNWNNTQSTASKTPETVTIGTQIWMGKNLDVTTFRNGDAIAEVKTDAEWQSVYDNKKPAWCYYNNDPANGAKYGKLYNWWAVFDARGLAPAGWHIPYKKDFDVLRTTFQTRSGQKMKSVSGWKESTSYNNGTNDLNFSALPGGYRLPAPDSFQGMGSSAWWWTATKTVMMGVEMGNGYKLDYDDSELRDETPEYDGLSVRCVKD